jgi:methyltransferase (TIGR00027 family)
MKTIPKPNFTAWFVMQGFIAAMRHPDYRSISDPEMLGIYEKLAVKASKTRLVSRMIHALPYRLQYCIGELVTNRGRLRHFIFRKTEIRKQAAALLEQGKIKQVIVLGAGLDMLSLWLSERYKDIRCIEIDTSESQVFKIEALQQMLEVMPDRVEFIEGDLRNPLKAILSGSRQYDPLAKTLWIAEGFFMFIPEESVTRIFQEMHSASAKGSTVIFTTIPSKKITSAMGHVIQTLYLQKEKSPFNWVLPHEKVAEYIKSMGYYLVLQLPCDLLHKRYIGGKYKGNHNFAEDIHIANTPVL